MTEHTDLIPMTDDQASTPGFDLVRRGYDPHQVDAHIGWLEERLREAEAQRASAEATAAQAAHEAGLAQDELTSNRPQWETFGGRITSILQLAEEEGVAIRQKHSREADQRLEQARRQVADTERTAQAKIAAAEQKAQERIRSAESESERLVREAKEVATQQQRESERRLAELSRQRDQVHNQLSRLRDGLAAAMAPFDATGDADAPRPGGRSERSTA